MRYHVLCNGEMGEATWSMESFGGPAFTIDGSAWRDTRAFSVFGGPCGPTVGRLSSTWRHYHCDVYRHDERIAEISTSFLHDIRARFIGEVPGPDVLTLNGCFLEQNYRFLRCQRTVATVSTVWDAGGEGFAVEVRDNEDQALIVATALSIRCLCGAPRRAASLVLQPMPGIAVVGRMQPMGVQG